MQEIPWIRTGTDQYEYAHKDVVFKRKGKPGAYRYQVWKDGVLIDNRLPDHYAVLRYIRDGPRILPW